MRTAITKKEADEYLKNSQEQSFADYNEQLRRQWSETMEQKRRKNICRRNPEEKKKEKPELRSV